MVKSFITGFKNGFTFNTVKPFTSNLYMFAHTSVTEVICNTCGEK
jgi:hypothetical protein